jgi:hypothetical protein
MVVGVIFAILNIRVSACQSVPCVQRSSSSAGLHPLKHPSSVAGTAAILGDIPCQYTVTSYIHGGGRPTQRGLHFRIEWTGCYGPGPNRAVTEMDML